MIQKYSNAKNIYFNSRCDAKSEAEMNAVMLDYSEANIK